MADAPDGYRKELREVFVKKNSDFSDSRAHVGLNSGLARDRKTNDLSHSLIGDRVEPGSGRSEAVPQWVEAPDASAPDISGLVPIALVALAGVAAGVAGARIVEKRKRRQGQSPSIGEPSATPPGWYAVASDPTRLRYWNGTTWTNDYALRAGAGPSIAADWYPDPSNAAQFRYWDGSVWTHHVSPRAEAVALPPDWYPDPSNAARLRYWDGAAWTAHVATSQAAQVAARQGAPTASPACTTPAQAEPRIHMSSAEWRAHLEAWARAGAIQQELWRRLADAHITDADDATLAARRQWEVLTPEEGARRLRLVLEAHPSLRSQSALVEFVNLFAHDRATQPGVATTAGPSD